MDVSNSLKIVFSPFQNALIELWELAYPNRETPPLKSELWKEMGWQGCDPSTDFRYNFGGGKYYAFEIACKIL